MHKRLRLQLTLLYLFAGLVLAALLGAGSYSLLRNTLENTTDLAIQYKMTAAFDAYGIVVPDELSAARSTWLQTYAAGEPVRPASIFQEDEDSDEEHDSHEQEEHPEEGHEEDLFDARLAALFVFPLDANGTLIENPNSGQPPAAPDRGAAAAALSSGLDWRTLTLPNNQRVRLLTYRTDSLNGPALIQVGRLLNDQDRAISQFLASLILLDGLGIVVLGGLSWWLSGRTLGPAQQAWDQQQVFVANASHELRTPLTLIRASAEYGLMSSTDPEIRPLLEDIRKETDYMNRLVEDLLTLSRLDAKRLKLERLQVSVPDLVKEVCSQMQKLVAERGIRLEMGEVAGVIRGDAVRLRQVLLILLDNAFRFTPPGGTVTLEAGVQKKRVFILVTDTGSGIAPEHLVHVFDRFYQAGTPLQDGAHSNGLGLSIARSLVEAQGGLIHLESRVGVGTRVRLEFPVGE